MFCNTTTAAALTLLALSLTATASAQEARPVLPENSPITVMPHQPVYGHAEHPPQSESTAPGWDWELPIVPLAGRADSRQIHFARVDDGHLEVYTSDLFLPRLQRRAPVFPEWTLSGRQETPYEAPAVFAMEGGWIVTEGGQGVRMTGDEGAPVSPVLFAELGLKEIEHVIVAEDRFFVQGVSVDVFGDDDRGIWYAPYSLSGPSENWQRVPPPPGNLQDYGWTVSNGRVVIAGGTELGEKTNLVRSYQFNRGAESWRQLMYTLPTAPGPTALLAINSLAVAFPASPAKDAQGDWPLQRVYWAHDRADVGGTIDEWLTFTYDFPAPRAPIIMTIPNAHIIVFAGGIDGPTGEPNRMAYLRAARDTNQYRAIVNPPRLPAYNPLGIAIERRNEITFAHYQTALKRARSQQKHHVVFILDEEHYDDEESRMRFLRDTNVIYMLQEMVVSTPWPDDLPAVREMIGTDEWPAVALLSPEGELLDTFVGIPGREEMFRLLLPAWGPTAVAAPGYLPPLQ